MVMVSQLLFVFDKAASQENQIFIDQAGDNADLFLEQIGTGHDIWLESIGTDLTVSAEQNDADQTLSIDVEGSSSSPVTVNTTQSGTSSSISIQSMCVTPGGCTINVGQ
jgi:hypothetical protein